MRPDLVVPGENEENFVAARDTRVVTVPFSPIEKRFAKEKPQLMPGLKMLREELGDAEFDRLINRIHNINVIKTSMTVMPLSTISIATSDVICAQNTFSVLDSRRLFAKGALIPSPIPYP